MTYAYSQKKQNLVRFVVDNISLFSLGDPDFVNQLFNAEFFNDKIYEIVLDSLVERDFILDHKVSLIATIFQ